MTADATEALARALDDHEHPSDARTTLRLRRQHLTVSVECHEGIIAALAALGYEVRPIRNWSSFGMDSGFAGFYHQHIPECDPDCVLNVVRDSWKIEELPIHSVTAEAAAVLLRDTPEDREWLAFRLHEAFWHGEHEFEVGCADGKQDADGWRRKADAIIAGLRGEK